MANPQITEEELQRSVVLSEEDADFDDEDPASAMALDTTASPGSARNLSRSQPSGDEQNGHQGLPNDDDDEEEDDDDDELSQVPDDEIDSQLHPEGSSSIDGAHEDDDDDNFEDDAEGDEDDNVEAVAAPRMKPRTNRTEAAAENGDDDMEDEDGQGEEEDEEEAEDAEGVGAVKIKPGDTDDDSDSDISLPSASSDNDSAAEWQDAVENGEDDDDDDSEAADSSVCMFCKKDEEHDPAEEFESYLSCKGCTEHAHQQCARDADALTSEAGSSEWKCPDCIGDSDSEAPTETRKEYVETDPVVQSTEDVDADEEMGAGDISSTSTRRTSALKAARDSHHAHQGEKEPSSRSASNQPTLEEDGSLDGPRVLRKRKTSSPEADDDVITLRKRRRNIAAHEPAPEDAVVPATDNQEDTQTSVRSRSVRSARLKTSSSTDLCTVLKKSRSSFTINIRVNPSDLSLIISQDPKSTRKRSRRTTASRPPRKTANTVAANTTATATNTTTATASTSSHTAATAVAEPAAITPVFASSYSQPFYSFYDRETDELKGKPYGGILSEEQADTTKTLPTKDDRRRFDEAKQKAEEEWRNRLLAMQAESDQPVKKSKKTQGPASQIECIEFGGWEIDTWYAAPYPEEYSRNRVLYICEFCLKYMNSDYVAWRHKLKCPAKHPPGDEIYRHGSISFFEVDGRKNPVYCQNLCLLAKLFLGSKTLYYDVEPFLFYVLCEFDELGYHFVGYFSKEKRASSQNNVSCILTLPIHQRKGYGNLLIDFSYLLTRVEKKTGSPEKPLSDMGLVSYRNYWRLVISKYLIDLLPEDNSQKTGLSIRKISDDTGMVPDDVISALEGLRCLVRDPVTHTYAFRVDLPYCRQYLEKWEGKNYVGLRPEVLTWTPYVMGRSNATNFELGPALNTIAPREEDEDNKTVQVLAESGIATGDFAITNHIMKKAVFPDEATVLESTEPNDHTAVCSGADIKMNGLDQENHLSREHTQGKTAESSASAAAALDENSWQKAYEDIPVSRFQVFPAANHRRPGPSRIMTSTVTRPSLPRVPATLPRPKPKPRRPTTASGGSNSARMAAAPKKVSSAKRKTGGTGRGPGRWPKGTKKSDYGNADSGPGLPPGWLERQKQLTGKKAEDIKAEVAAAAAAGNPIDTSNNSIVMKSIAMTNGDAAKKQAQSQGGQNATGNPDAKIGATGKSAMTMDRSNGHNVGLDTSNGSGVADVAMVDANANADAEGEDE